MGSNTTNYSLYKPAVDEKDWGATVNTSTDAIDTQMKVNADAAALNTTHRTSNGTNHSYIDQSVVSGATPTFTGTNFTGVPAAGILAGSMGTGAFTFDNTVQAADFSDGTTTLDVSELGTSSIGFFIDGGGVAITTGIKGDIEVPFACTIQRVTMLLDQSATTTVDIWKDTYANYPPTNADSITAAAVPGTSASDKDQDATLTSWTVSVAAGDTLRFNVDANDNATTCLINLKVIKV